jgi:hypothetical protein
VLLFDLPIHFEVFITIPLIRSRRGSKQRKWQLLYMKDALTFFGGNVTAVFWYSLLDNSWEQEQSNPQSFGLFRNETTRRASFRALQNFVSSNVS